jgi:hypothetical protein
LEFGEISSRGRGDIQVGEGASHEIGPLLLLELQLVLYAVEVIEVLLLLLEVQLLQRVVHRRLVTALGRCVPHHRREQVLVLHRNVARVAHVNVQGLVGLDRQVLVLAPILLLAYLGRSLLLVH